MNHNHEHSHKTGENCPLAQSRDQAKIIAEIAKIKELPALEAIIEVTYKYKNFFDENGEERFFNTFFTDLTGFSFEEIISQEISGQKIIKVSENTLDKYLAKMNEIDAKIEASYCSPTEKILLKNIVKSHKNKLNITKLGLSFELEKSGILTDILREEKAERIAKMNEIQNVEFGKNISENPAEILQTLFWIRKNFHKNKKFLSENEKIFLENCYEKMANFSRGKF